MEKNFYANHATSAWLRYAAPAVVAAFFSTAVYAQEAPSKPSNLKATETSGYVTLSWDRFAKADTLLNEGFEDDNMPETWTVKVTNTYDPTFTWFRFPTASMEEDGDEEEMAMWRHSGKGSAVISWDQACPHEDGSSAVQDEWLIMPATKGAQCLNFYTYIAPELLEYGAYEDFPDHYYVKVSHDGGKTWNEIWDARYDSNGSDGWQLVSLYLGDASEGDAIVAFEAKSNPDDDTSGLYFTWAIDDVSLYTSAVDAANAPAKNLPNISKTLKGLPAYRPFAITGKRVAQPKKSAYKVVAPAETYNVLLDGELIANIKSTEYTDKSEKTSGEHTYGVQAVNGELASEIAEVKVKVTEATVNAPRDVKATAEYDEESGKYNVKLTWNAPEGDRLPDHYECYANGALFAGWIEPDELVAEQTGVNRGVQYYSVKAVYANPEGESELVGDLVAIGTRNTPYNLEVNVEDGNAKLAWIAPTASEYEVEKYQIFRGNTQLGETPATEFTDENIPDGVYDYSVKAVYADGFVSLPVTVETAYGDEQIYDLPFAEDFTGGLKPSDWTIERVNTSMKTDYLWRFDNWYELNVTGGGFDKDFASMTSSISPMVSMFAVLETPAIYDDVDKDEKVTLEFDLDYSAVEKTTGKKSNAGLRYSFNKEDWANVCDEFTGYDESELAEGETCKPEHFTLDVTKCFQEGCPVYFGWYYEARQAKHIAVDNVRIYKENASGISVVENSKTNTNAPVYNLNGQYVANGRKGLASGVYIQNGKKIVVK